MKQVTEWRVQGVDMNETVQLRLLAWIERDARREFVDWAAREPAEVPRFRFGASIESVDAEMLYSLIRLARPRRVVEIGSVRLRAEPVQAVAISEFEALRARDILFIDASHVCKIGK